MKIRDNVYVTPTGFKVTSRGKVVPKSAFLQSLPKSERRKIRKECFRAGYYEHASA